MTQKLQHEYQRAQCVTLSNAGFSCREASKVVGISKSSVQRTIKRFEETDVFHNRRHSGRPKKLNDRNIRMLKRLTENNGRNSSHERTNKLNNSLKNLACKTIVTTYLHENGYENKKVISYHKTEKERLN